jgi:hypothetical protein
LLLVADAMKKRQHAWRTAFRYISHPKRCCSTFVHVAPCRALDENFTGTLPDKQFLDVLMKVNFSLPKTQLMQIAALCTDSNVGGGRSFAPGSTHVNYNVFLRRVEAVLKVTIPSAL